MRKIAYRPAVFRLEQSGLSVWGTAPYLLILLALRRLTRYNRVD